MDCLVIVNLFNAENCHKISTKLSHKVVTETWSGEMWQIGSLSYIKMNLNNHVQCVP